MVNEVKQVPQLKAGIGRDRPKDNWGTFLVLFGAVQLANFLNGCRVAGMLVAVEHTPDLLFQTVTTDHPNLNGLVNNAGQMELSPASL